MNTIHKIKFSPVKIEDRKKLDIRSGDTVRVWQRVKEGNKTRLQAFEGLVLARKHGAEPGGTFTVRKVVDGIGVERIFPLYSPTIEKIELVRRSKVRRAKLYYIREKATRAARRKMKQMRIVNEVVMETKEDEPEKPQDGEENADTSALTEAKKEESSPGSTEEKKEA
ncbi:MAG: 50S ribosomal protein L19 [Candidatus Niyogibacteria bacterium CG10_big_fil_rev_8_21_14_0_10_46_36]|uniref:Large ribosomal subunit protein bL19 n=1 Tax=Candidatus Niyogibacteria bacterium CG10_big_fil_rev_8_21_14_0_10_46_36 TaxID=1974726 RepID=A0A2H0TCI6_9BACT|nr:MAG: 50S ribosomal protein L19 [Candidatus Niyogibacteria bacterium CG10_big_fil_rev_8_21_14_0_10_46_36]